MHSTWMPLTSPDIPLALLFPSSVYMISSSGLRTRLRGMAAVIFSRQMRHMDTGSIFEGVVLQMIPLLIYYPL